MKLFTYKVQDDLGIHARPAGLLVKLAKSYHCDITLKKDSQQVDAKKIMAVMSMAVKQGQQVELIFDGEDEDQAALALETFFKENL